MQAIFFPLPVASNFSNCIRDHALHGVPVFESHGAPRASCPHRGFDEQPRGLFTRGPPPPHHTHTLRQGKPRPMVSAAALTRADVPASLLPASCPSP